MDDRYLCTALCVINSIVYLASHLFSLKSVDRTDSGKYWCQVEINGKKEESQQVWLIVEGKQPCFWLLSGVLVINTSSSVT